jgi:Recombination enhancement, RecA-dependent nuclease
MEAQMSAAGKKHMARVRDLGCIVCRNVGLGATAASAHHINAKGVGMKASDFQTIGLCPIHHQYGDGSERFKGQIAVHRGLESFEKRYGTERELLEQTLRELENA